MLNRVNRLLAEEQNLEYMDPVADNSAEENEQPNKVRLYSSDRSRVIVVITFLRQICDSV